MSSPTRPFEPEARGVPAGSATLGKNVTIKGQIFSREDLTIDGEVEARWSAMSIALPLAPTPVSAQAGLKAREIVIYGSIQGNVEAADKIDSRRKRSW